MPEKKAPAPAPKRKSPPCPPPAKAIKRITPFTRITAIAIASTLKCREIQLLIRQPAFTCTTHCLAQPQVAVLQTPEQDRISSLNPICSFLRTRPKPSSTFKTRSETATVTLRFKQRRQILRKVTTQRSISGAPQAQRPGARLIEISGSKTGRRVWLFAIPPLLAARK